jgi:DnaJ-class molecular chaperone
MTLSLFLVSNRQRRLVMRKTSTVEIECDYCEGGKVRLKSRCPRCDGKRVVPTELGQEILDLIRRHLKDC